MAPSVRRLASESVTFLGAGLLPYRWSPNVRCVRRTLCRAGDFELFHEQARRRLAQRLMSGVLNKASAGIMASYPTFRPDTPLISALFAGESPFVLEPVETFMLGQCNLFPRDDRVFRIANPAGRQFFADLFYASCEALRALGVPADVNRYDLHHAHLFDADSYGPGLLFHACEYPAYGDECPYYLGYCQRGSTLRMSTTTRNLLWLERAGDRVSVLDMRSSSPFRGLLYPGQEPLGTIYERDFGPTAADLVFLPDHSIDVYLIPYLEGIA